MAQEELQLVDEHAGGQQANSLLALQRDERLSSRSRGVQQAAAAAAASMSGAAAPAPADGDRPRSAPPADASTLTASGEAAPNGHSEVQLAPFIIGLCAMATSLCCNQIGRPFCWGMLRFHQQAVSPRGLIMTGISFCSKCSFHILCLQMHLADVLCICRHSLPPEAHLHCASVPITFDWRSALHLYSNLVQPLNQLFGQGSIQVMPEQGFWIGYNTNDAFQIVQPSLVVSSCLLACQLPKGSLRDAGCSHVDLLQLVRLKPADYLTMAHLSLCTGYSRVGAYCSAHRQAQDDVFRKLGCHLIGILQ